jgi:PIN domain nuclease of toxin-antitoxin system
MEDIVYLDTHVVVWLYAGRSELLSEQVADLIQQNDILISPIVELELQYLFETERILVKPDKILDVLSTEIQLKICDLPFQNIINKAVSLNWTRDPFDRIITSQASVYNRILITKDQTILENHKNAIW